MGNESIYSNFEYGLLEGLIFQDSLVKADPLMNIIDEEFGNAEVYP